MTFRGDPVRVLIVPGLHGSGPAHWQTWLEHHFRRSARVHQDDWARADLDLWARRIEETVASHPTACWVAVAHSFGCLALVRHLAARSTGIEAALLVAPADPEKFGASASLPQGPLGLPTTLLASQNDPWMRPEAAHDWSRRWGSRFLNLGHVGHINTESGFGPLPQAKALVERMIQRVERRRRSRRAHPLEFAFAI